MQSAQQRVDLACPRLLLGVIFDDRQQLAQVVGVAQRVDGVLIGAVLRPAIVHGDSAEARHHASVVDALGSAPVVQGVEGQRLGARAVQPSSTAAGASAGLIEVHDRRVDDLLVHALEELVEVLGAFLDEGHECRGRDRRAQPIGQQLRGALVGQVLGGDQIDPERSHSRPVLRRGANAGRERRGRHVPAHATPPLGTVLADSEAHLRQVEHLACLLANPLAVGEIAAAAAAAIWRVQDDLIRLLDPLEMMATMAGLTTRFAARPTTKTPRCRRLGQTIRRRRSRRVTRVRRQPRPQLRDLRPQLRNQRCLRDNKSLQILIRRPIHGHTTTFAPTPPPPARPEQSLNLWG